MKTKSIILSALFYILGSFSLLVFATSETRPVNSFQQVEASTGIEVIYTASNSYSLKVEADEAIISRVKTEVHNGVLKIYLEKGKKMNTKGKIIVSISAPTLNKISLSSGAIFTTKEITNAETINIELSSGSITNIAKLVANELNVAVSSGANGYANIAVDNVNIKVSSGGIFEVGGKTKNVNAHCSSGGHINIKNLAHETIVSHKSSGGFINQ